MSEEKVVADPTIMTVRVGQEIEREIATSPALTLILEEAAEVSEQALGELKVCDPTDARRIATLQAKALWFEQVETWLNQTILAGKNAARFIQEPGEGEQEPEGYP